MAYEWCASACGATISAALANISIRPASQNLAANRFIQISNRVLWLPEPTVRLEAIVDRNAKGARAEACQSRPFVVTSIGCAICVRTTAAAERGAGTTAVETGAVQQIGRICHVIDERGQVEIAVESDSSARAHEAGTRQAEVVGEIAQCPGALAQTERACILVVGADKRRLFPHVEAVLRADAARPLGRLGHPVSIVNQRTWTGFHRTGVTRIGVSEVERCDETAEQAKFSL